MSSEIMSLEMDVFCLLLLIRILYQMYINRVQNDHWNYFYYTIAWACVYLFMDAIWIMNVKHFLTFSKIQSGIFNSFYFCSLAMLVCSWYIYVQKTLHSAVLKHKKISIKWLVFGGLLAFTSVVMCLLWLFQTVFLEDFYKQIKTSEIKKVASEIAENIDAGDITRQIAAIARSQSVCALVMNDDGTVVSSAEGAFSCVIHKMTCAERKEIIDRAKSGGGVYSTVFDMDFINAETGFRPQTETGGEPLAKGLLYAEIVSSNGTSYAIMLNSQITPVDATVSTLRVQLLIITGIVIVLAVVLAVVIMKVVSSPISSVNESAKRLARADYSVAFDESGYKEISELAATLNYAASELNKTDVLQKELIANVSHDLRTPLTMIGGYAEMMRDIPEENNAANAQIIVDEAKRLTTLVNDTLDLSKLGSGTSPLTLSRLNVTESVRNILTRYSELREREGYAVAFEYDRDVFVDADEIKLTQVVYNLINNAVNYCGEDKKITVRQTVSDGVVRFDFIDNGAGIAPEELPTVWDRYYRSRDVHKRAVVGTGLGLSIVYQIVELHAGTIGVDSVEGSGSVFTVRIPLAAEREEELLPEEAPQ